MPSDVRSPELYVLQASVGELQIPGLRCRVLLLHRSRRVDDEHSLRAARRSSRGCAACAACYTRAWVGTCASGASGHRLLLTAFCLIGPNRGRQVSLHLSTFHWILCCSRSCACCASSVGASEQQRQTRRNREQASGSLARGTGANKGPQARSRVRAHGHPCISSSFRRYILKSIS